MVNLKKIIREKYKVMFIFSLVILNLFAVNNIFATNNTTVTTTGTEEVQIYSNINTKNINPGNEIVDLVVKEGIYKLSEDKNEIYLPYFRYASERIALDKEVSNVGFSFSGATIDVTAPLKNTQVLFASDSVRINNKMERTVVFSGSDVVIDSEISGTVFIFASNTITITENAKIGEDVICFCDNVNLEGVIEGSLIGFFNKATINGQIKKDLRAEVENVDIKSNNNIVGNILLKTYSNDLTIKDKYPNAIVEILKSEETKVDYAKNIFKVIVASLIFAILYLLINKISKNDFIGKAYKKSKTNTSVIFISGIVLLLSMPIALIMLLVLSIIGLGSITLPIMIAYIAFMWIAGLISIFVVGTIMFKHMKEKYMQTNGLILDFIGMFFVYLTLKGLTYIPYVGGIIGVTIYIVSIGILFTLIFKKDKLIVNKINNVNGNT